MTLLVGRGTNARRRLVVTKTATFTDDFATADTTKWSGFSADVAVTSGQLVVNAAPNYPSVTSVLRYDFTNSALFVKVAAVPNIANGSTAAFLTAAVDGSNEITMAWTNGNLEFTEKVAGVASTTAIVYVGATHRWWRISEAAGTVTWASSTDGITWTTQRTKTTILNLTSVAVLLFAGNWNAAVTPGSATFDDMNVAPVGSNITFTPTEDTTTYIANPGIGWQETDTDRSDTPPETTQYRRSVGSFFWGAINTANGVYDWSRIDDFLTAAAAAGEQGSFRVVSMRGESFGNHQIPAWVVTEDSGCVGGPSSSGTNYRAGVEPNYENRTYQIRWAQFCEAMRVRYDGDTRIAFVDISGYGDFNEWTYLANHDFQTNPGAPPSTSYQAMARRFLVHLFVGGSVSNHTRRTAGNASTETVSYNYPGWQSTQLMQPNAGMRHHGAWVLATYSHVGARQDVLGANPSGATHWGTTALGAPFTGSLYDYIRAGWLTAPIGYELSANNTNWANQLATLGDTHGSYVHDNLTSDPRPNTDITATMLKVGYRLAITGVDAISSIARGADMGVTARFVNRGYAPPYPRMGQTFELRFALRSGSTLSSVTTLASDPITWVPNADVASTPPTHTKTGTVAIAGGQAVGTYTASIAVWDTRRNVAILLANTGRNAATGYYDLGTITVT